MKQLFTSDMWTFFEGRAYDYQTQLFEPVGGMGMIGKAFGQQLNGSDQVQLQGHQHSAGRQRRHRHLSSTPKKGGAPQTAHADWCVCTIPASVLSQIPLNVGAPMKNAINSLSYELSFKVGLQFKRRFWEEDDGIYGGISYTDQPITNISYPSTGFFKDGPAVLLGGYGYGNIAAGFQFRRDVAGGPGEGRRRAGLENPSAIQEGIPERRGRGLASRALHAWLCRQLDG